MLIRSLFSCSTAKLDQHYKGIGTPLSPEDVKELHQALADSSKWFVFGGSRQRSGWMDEWDTDHRFLVHHRYKEQQLGMAAGLATEEA